MFSLSPHFFASLIGINIYEYGPSICYDISNYLFHHIPVADRIF